MDCPPVLSLDGSLQDPAYFEIRQHFESCFKKTPSFYVRVPGRVNLIGEHIDYCGYAVLPMALEQDIIMAVRVNHRGTINLLNFESKKYESFSSPVRDLSIDRSSPKWYHYFICGYKGIAENYKLTKGNLDVVVKGIIPPSSGLSSSSALVCASALATCFANKISLTKMEMASLCAASERYIGTQGGGMDQAIGFLAESGTAKLIEFNPLRTTNVPLPEEVVFVVSNSCVNMNKAVTSQFNMRVVECRLAAKVLAKKHGLNWRDIEKLCQIPILLEQDISDMKDIIEKTLPPKWYNRTELCSILEITDEEFINMLSENTRHFQLFKLSERATHVFEEAARVRKFKLICDEGKHAIQELGNLMNESHQSCRDLYECSHPVLEELVETALKAGAIGSRLTGAGWGGCCVSLVMKKQVEQFLNFMKENFYQKRTREIAGIDVDKAIFVTKPGNGAAVYVNK